ncbi:hypothetical protein [Sphingomonas sp.]|uniref:hypothetical protein n=1 Tax=Sphingomonas sp. TaxID=28214 RepID=UPI001DB44309|nr:hypothetical protein [Sphingomonas sp.]MBX9797773.1 hypothetical protein [Sphingomonas sp.]
MAVIEVLMPAAGSSYGEMAVEGVEAYRAAFAAQGLTLAPRRWDAPAGGDAKAALAMFAWGYHADPAGWAAPPPAGRRRCRCSTRPR